MYSGGPACQPIHDKVVCRRTHLLGSIVPGGTPSWSHSCSESGSLSPTSASMKLTPATLTGVRIIPSQLVMGRPNVTRAPK